MSEFEELDNEIAQDEAKLAQLRSQYSALVNQTATQAPCEDFSNAAEGKRLEDEIEALDEELSRKRLLRSDQIGNR